MIRPGVTFALWLAITLLVLLNNVVGDTWIADRLSAMAVESGAEVRLRLRDGKAASLRVARVVNCSGPCTDVRVSNEIGSTNCSTWKMK